MKIISHRGYWLTEQERNLDVAFLRSFNLDFGTETDLRDYSGEIVISHDIPAGNEISFHKFLDLYKSSTGKNLPLALNIKSDGLVNKLKLILEEYKGIDAFVFDMSVPDMRSYMSAGIPFFTRMSEVERDPAWFENASGVWLDSFGPIWYDNEVISSLLSSGKRVCVVSPELHHQDSGFVWTMLSKFTDASNLILCTDHPEAARKFFNL